MKIPQSTHPAQPGTIEPSQVQTKHGTTLPLPCPTCPLPGRLEQAKAHFRAQQREIAQLQERLARYQRIGLRRVQQALHPAAQALYASLIWAENVFLRRETARQRQAIHDQAQLIRHQQRTLHDFHLQMMASEAANETEEVA